MSEVRLTETEQKVFELLKSGVSGIDDVVSALEKQEGHEYTRGVVVRIMSRLYNMNLGIKKIAHRPKVKTRYLVAQA